MDVVLIGLIQFTHTRQACFKHVAADAGRSSHKALHASAILLLGAQCSSAINANSVQLHVDYNGVPVTASVRNILSYIQCTKQYWQSEDTKLWLSSYPKLLWPSVRSLRRLSLHVTGTASPLKSFRGHIKMCCWRLIPCVILTLVTYCLPCSMYRRHQFSHMQVVS